MTLFLIVLHVLAALGVAAGWRMGKLHLSPVLLPVVFLLPLWGPVCAFVVEMHYRGGEKSDEEPVTGRFGITDEVYRSIRMEEAGIQDILPIGDVLAEGTPKQRRRLLLSVLHAGPKPFVRPLRVAGVNEDTEVVHYAVTALVELRSEYAQRTARMEAAYRERPLDPDILLEYADLDEEYVKSGIPEKNERAERLQHCRGLLEKLLNYNSWRDASMRKGSSSQTRNAGLRCKGTKGTGGAGDDGTGRENTGNDGMGRENAAGAKDAGRRMESNESLLKRLGEICLQQEDAAGAEEAAKRLIRSNPDDEAGYLLLLRAKVLSRDRNAITGIISEVEDKGIYISPAGRELLKFWAA